MAVPPSAVETAQLAWGDDALPQSTRFDDIYFSRADGLAESRFVFLHHNALPECWQTLAPNACFVVGETGFGTGLNFLACWQAWQASGARGRLHFVSVEKYPLSRADLERALALWPELNPLSRQLIDQYPQAIAGTHQLRFDQGRVRLTLMIGDAATSYAALQGKVDAWFLDGFAPAKNPGMWTPELFSALARCSHAGTTFATFTAAALVRQGLTDAGFTIEKVKGFGRKRHMLKGVMPQQTPQPQQWFSPPAPVTSPAVTIIGAGIAGAATARALADRGIRVQVFERHALPAQEGSGNPQGVLYLKLPVRPTPQSQIHLHGYQHSLRLLNATQDPQLWQPCGVLQIADSPEERVRQQRMLAESSYPTTLVRTISATDASALAGLPIGTEPLYFPDGGWLAPQRWCQQLLDHPLITITYRKALESLIRLPTGWQLRFTDGSIHQSSTLVIACAASAKQFAPLAHLPLKSIRGQISIAKPAPALQPHCVLCGKGYVTPPHADQLCFGATFTLHEQRPEPSNRDHQANQAHLAELATELAEKIDPTQLSGRVAFRCTTPDYLPLAGPVADTEPFRTHYAVLQRDATRRVAGSPPLQPGLYVNLGHGSKGMLTAPLCAELLACQISGEPQPLAETFLPYLHPARFLIKELKQRSI